MRRLVLLLLIVVCSGLGAGEKGRFSFYGQGGYFLGNFNHTAGYPAPVYSPAYIPAYKDDFISESAAGLLYGGGIEHFYWDSVALGISIDKWSSGELTHKKDEEDGTVCNIQATTWLIPILFNISKYYSLSERVQVYGKIGAGFGKFAGDTFYSAGEGSRSANGFRESPSVFLGGGGVQVRRNTNLAFYSGAEFLCVMHELPNLDKKKEKVMGMRLLAGVKLSTKKPCMERPGYYQECLKLGKKLIKAGKYKKALMKFRDAYKLKPGSKLEAAISKLEKKVAEELAHYKATAPRFRVGGYGGYVMARCDGKPIGGDISYRFYRWGFGVTRLGLAYESDWSIFETDYDLAAVIGYLQVHGRKWRIKAGWGRYNEEYEHTLNVPEFYKYEYYKISSNGPAAGIGFRLGNDSIGIDIEALVFYPRDDTISNKAAYSLFSGGISIGM